MAFPRPSPAWAVQVQRSGRSQFGPDFLFLGDLLHQFGQSDRASRERLPDGAVQFVLTPSLGEKFIVFSGSMATSLARYRLDPNHTNRPMVSPFGGVRFAHPATRWFNLNSALGAASFFKGNSPQILDFFARLISKNIGNGRRTLLVVRKCFLRFCQAEVQRRLRELGHPTVRVITRDWQKIDLHEPTNISLITYGVVGLNRFQHVEYAYCLTGFYVPGFALEELLNDLEPTGDHHRLEVNTVGSPLRRQVRLTAPRATESVLDQLAPELLVQKEADVILQAVGRVRPLTQPREVITFHLGELPGVRYTREFRNLDDARKHFELPPPAQGRRDALTDRIIRLHIEGLTQKAIAAVVGKSESTVKRRLSEARGQNALKNIEEGN